MGLCTTYLWCKQTVHQLTDCQQNCYIQGTKEMNLSREVGDYHSSATSSTSRWKPKNVDRHLCVLTK